MVQTEVEGIARIRIDQLHVGVGHDQLAKSNGSAAVRDMVSACSGCGGSGRTEAFLQSIAEDVHASELAPTLGRRQYGIKDQIFVVHAYTVHVFAVDQVVGLHAKEIQQAFHWKM